MAAVLLALGGFEARATLLSITPAVLAVALAFITRNLYLSLGVAILVGALFLTGTEGGALSQMGQSAVLSVQLALGSLAVTDNVQILGFVILVLTTVQIMQRAGGVAAVTDLLSRWVRGPRSAQWVTYIMGLLLFIDDYTNTMVVGSSMKKLTGRYRVSKEKLAFLVDATSGPVAGVAVVSTWIGFETGLFGEFARSYGLNKDGYALFFEALPFRFYCFAMLAFVAMLLIFNIDFGPMRAAQKAALKKESLEDEDLSAGEVRLKGSAVRRLALSLGLLPLLSLVGYVLVRLYKDGSGAQYGWAGVLNWRAWYHAVTHFEGGIRILLESSIIAFALAGVLALALQAVRARRGEALAPPTLFQLGQLALGAFVMPVSILLLAWALKDVVVGLEADQYLSSLLVGTMAPALFPAAVFVLAGIMGFSTGTSWGTMAILIPVLAPVGLALGEEAGMYLLPMVLAAILDGGIMGDHCSPISDTSIMSSLSTGCDLISHVRTQMPYGLLVSAVVVVGGYALTPVVGSVAVAWVAILFTLALTLWWIKRRQQRLGL